MKLRKNITLFLIIVLIFSTISFIYADNNYSDLSIQKIARDCLHDWGGYSAISDTKHEKECRKSECRKREEENHSWTYSWLDDERHVNHCSKCMHMVYKSHSWNNPTSDNTYCLFKTCRLCNYDIKVFHELDSNYQHDSMYHWYKCKKCDKQVSKTLHQFNYIDCDENNHKKVCRHCKRTLGTMKHDFEFEVVGSQGHRNSCKECKRKENIIPHNLSVKSVNKEQHKSHCSTCSYESPLENHNWVNGTCSQCGEKKCQHAETEAIGAGSRQHAIICVSGCGKIVRLEDHNFIENALGHTFCDGCGISKGEGFGF